MDATELWLQEIRDRARANKIAFVCGTGISASVSGQPGATWSELLLDGLDFVGSLGTADYDKATRFKSMIKEVPDADTFITVAEWLQRRLQDPINAGEYRAWLERTVGKLTPADTEWGRVFSLPVPVLTTNYDSLLEDVTDRRPLTWTDLGKIDKFADHPETHVFHVHGHYQTPESVILSGSDYTRLAMARPVAKVLETISHSHTLLLMGYGSGIADPNFSAFLNWFRENYGETARKIFVLVREIDLPSPLLSDKVAFLSYGYEHSDLLPFLTDLLNVPLSRGGTSPADPCVDRDGQPEQASSAGDLLEGLPVPVRNEVETQFGAVDALGNFQRELLERGAVALGEREPLLVSAVTGTGKTTLARVLMNQALARSTSAVMLLPTKALVAQELREWGPWVAAWSQADREIRVYGSSRDYPENDSPVSKGRFEVALAIYEKLAGYLVSGRSTLSNTGLLVVDELQTLVEDKERAVKLERLLTLIKLIPKDQRPSILGLSATLSERSTTALRHWLGVDGFYFLQSTTRPVPLDAYVLDETRWKMQPDAHLLSLGSEDIRVPDPRTKKHSFGEELRAFDSSKIQVHGLGTAPLAVQLVTHLVTTDPHRRIIVFVSGRTAAQELCSSIQRSLEVQLGAAPKEGSPWASSRFGAALAEEDAKEKYLSLKYSDLPQWEDVLRGLRHGVAFHSARLPSRLRQQLEDEFRSESGMLRVLVATDTLAQGINLPADAVVATSLASYGSDRSLRLATPAELDNKAGRAGRRGLARRERGEFYLLVPGEKDLEDVAGLTAQGQKDLSSVEGVFERYVASRDRTARVTGQVRTLEDVSLLVLQVLAADGYGRSVASLTGRIEAVLEALLVASEQPVPVALPQPEEVLARLQGQGLLALENGKYRLSILGLALARSGLSLKSSAVLERLARLVVKGAGDIDLLFNACRSSEIEAVTAWVGLPSVPRRHYPSLKEAIITYALAYLAETDFLREQNARLSSRGEKYPLPARFVREGQKVVSEELLRTLQANSELVEDRDATALLRAIVAFEWSRGIPFREIRARISSAIRSEEDRPRERPVELKVHYSDVEQLCEQVAGVLRGAVDVSFESGVDWSNRVRMLALQTEVGLPAWLAPVAKMRIECLHRGRLALLWDMQVPDSGWNEILATGPLKDHQGISSKERDAAQAQLENRQLEHERRRQRVAQEWASEFVPGWPGITFDELSVTLEEAPTAEAYAGHLRTLLKGIGADVTLGDTTHHVEIAAVAGDHQVVLLVPKGEIGEVEVRHVRERNCLVVLRSRIRPSAYGVLGSGGWKARFVQPEALLQLLARLVSRRGESLVASEVVEQLAGVRVSALDEDSVLTLLDGVQGPPPFDGPLPALEGAALDPTLVRTDEGGMP
ncbi:SIR2 family protein [Arsenicicoccus bolidensis]|uniref:SIR2 family protein n=1 Tax=Arsenicicoccus bolidensis TaxID=229480 RepID=UPI000422C75E|nr:SIR2 family protein [Arsenicicoccus bolidensis]